MSAIAGVISLRPDLQTSREEVAGMVEALAPFVDYETSSYELRNKIGALRIVSYGPRTHQMRQPLSENSTCSAVLIGELFNEGIETSYVDWITEELCSSGIEGLLQKINGSFVAVIVDERDKSVYVIGDHAATIPVFYTVQNDRLYFATEIKALSAIPSLELSLNLGSVGSLLVRGFVVNRSTLYNEIRQLGYGSYIQIRHGKISIKQYWQFRFDSSTGSGTDWHELLSDSMQRAVQRASRGKTLLLMSGGGDSRAISAFMDRDRVPPMVTYTGKPSEDRLPHGDAEIARRIALRYGVEHEILTLPHDDLIANTYKAVLATDGLGFLDEGVYSHINQYYGPKNLIIGDQCFGLALRWANNRSVLRRHGIWNSSEASRLLTFIRPEYRNEIAQALEQDVYDLLESVRGDSPGNQIDRLYFEQRLSHFILPKRRIIRYHGLGVRNPWLDRELLDTVRLLPEGLRVDKKLFRQVTRKRDPDVTRIPRSRDDEGYNYRAALGNPETNAYMTSRSLYRNRRFEEVFDIELVDKTLGRIARVQSVRGRKRVVPYLRDKIPAPIRSSIIALHYRGRDFQPGYTDVSALIRLLRVGMSIGLAERRFHLDPENAVHVGGHGG